MIPINPLELEWSATRAQGPGGQNVNKVSTALHLRYDIRASSLPGAVKDRLLRSGDQRISSDGVIVIKAQRYRSQERNRADAIARLQQLVDDAAAVHFTTGDEANTGLTTPPRRSQSEAQLDQERPAKSVDR